MQLTLDVLVFAAHPDDAELCCGGTILKLIAQGRRVGVVDMTGGELGTRGTLALRREEAAKASEIMGIHARENLGFRDGFFSHDEAHLRQVIGAIRAWQPDILLAPAIEDRHPDHGRASKLVRDAAFMSGLQRIETQRDGVAQAAWRPRQVFFYIQDHHLEPDFVVDITPWFEKKREALAAFGSQFYTPGAEGPETHISSRKFWHFVEARARIMGHMAGAEFGEGFQSERPLLIEDVLSL